MNNLGIKTNEIKKYLLINGEKVETKNYASLYSPYSQEKIAEIAMADKELTIQAIDAAHEAVN